MSGSSSSAGFTITWFRLGHETNKMQIFVKTLTVRLVCVCLSEFVCVCEYVCLSE